MQNMDLMGFGLIIFTKFLPFLFSLCFHEYAHGWMAQKFGDDTAKVMGRLTLNPVAHADIFGTLVFPILGLTYGGMFFGWAKPVPVNERNLQRPKQQMFWIAAAGPLSNIILACICAAVLFVVVQVDPTIWLNKQVQQFFGFFIAINLVLAVFNLIPLHPLDGGKILARFIPDDLNRKLEENQSVLMILLIVLIFTGALRFIFTPVMYGTSFLVALATGQY